MSSKSGSHTPDKKVLRIGLIQNGKILEERLMRSPKPVRIGQDLHKNDLIVPASDLPRSLQLFSVKNGAYQLHFDAKMSGRISMGDGVFTLDELRQQGKAVSADGGFQLPLTPRARGKVQIGEVTVLFQFVSPPPPVAQPVLPASMRGGWFRDFDLSLLGIIAISAIIQLGFVGYLKSQEWPEQIDRLNQRIPDRFVQLLREPDPEPVEIPEDQQVPQEVEGEGEGEAQPAPEQPQQAAPKPEKKDEPAVKKPAMSAEERAAAEEANRKKRMDDVRDSTILKQIGAIGGGSSGGIADVLAGGAGNTSMDEAFAGTKGVKAGGGDFEKSGLRSGGSSDADGTGSAAGIADLGATRGAKEAAKGVETGTKKEETVKARIKIDDGGQVIGTGQLDQAQITSVVRRNASAIQNCFERVLKQNPSAGGKLVITVTIGGAGRVTNVTTQTDIGGGFSQCAETAVKSWRFPRPQGGDVMFNKTFVLQASR